MATALILVSPRLTLAGIVNPPGTVDPGLKQLVAYVASNAARCRYRQAHRSTHAGVDAERSEHAFLNGFRCRHNEHGDLLCCDVRAANAELHGPAAPACTADAIHNSCQYLAAVSKGAISAGTSMTHWRCA
jgi:hypothetical protein